MTQRRRPIDPGMAAQLVKSSRWKGRVSLGGGCWEWTAGKSTHGYGVIGPKGGQLYAHRVAWVAAHGRDVPHGLEIDHLCRNRACVRPDHLDLVTHRVNTLRGFSPAAEKARREACDKGHPFTQYADQRRCRICKNTYEQTRIRLARERMEERPI